MKWKYILVGGAIAGAFTIGAVLQPIGEHSAATNPVTVVKKLPIVQTANETDTSQQKKGDFTCPMTGNVMGSGMGMGNYFSGSMSQVIADALNMTVDELQAARNDGKSIADLAKEKGVKTEDLVAKMIQSRKTELEQLVKEGKITQGQMDNMLKNMDVMMKSAIERDTVGPMNGQGRGMMGGRLTNNTENL